MAEINKIVKKLVVSLLLLYGYIISPLFGHRCRFYPSCSNYACVAIERFGICKGGWLALKRVGRCHPWREGGEDLVPKK